ncbi:MAG: VanZ family protein [candidate division WOR-3 bacterium]|nr:VanZ family protein [candidate division WOR-3 bacterium]
MRKTLIIVYVTLIVLVVTLLPLPRRITQIKYPWDKLTHLSVFGILGFVAQSAISLFSLVYGLFLASFTEFLQRFIPGRMPDFADWITNVIGIIIGSSFWELIRK